MYELISFILGILYVALGSGLCLLADVKTQYFISRHISSDLVGWLSIFFWPLVLFVLLIKYRVYRWADMW